MKKILFPLLVLTGFALVSCNDDFLEKYPITDITEENAFQSYDNFKAFTWPCYDMFQDVTIRTNIWNTGYQSIYLGDMDAGYLESRAESGFNKFGYQTVPSVATGNGWNFSSYIRRINIMLSHIEDSSMSSEEKDHWKAVGYFFHSFWYMELIDRFGDIPWVDKVLQNDSPELYEGRKDRKEVADMVMERLKWAEDHIGNFEKQDGANTINQDCIRAAISRFGLREGTWRKYHELGDYESFLKECVRASELLMQKYPTLYRGTDGQPGAGYGEMWTTEDLSKVPGIILFTEYKESIKTNHVCHVEHTTSNIVEMNSNTMNLYLMKNGKPIANPESGFEGFTSMYSEFRNRDPRLYHTILPPYVVSSTGGDYRTWSFTGNAADREYIDIMGINTACSNPGVGMKRLPVQNWSASLAPTIPRLGTSGFITCRSGYYLWKNYDCWETNYNAAHMNTADKPIFKIEEVLLNEAEAKFELNQFNQGVADATINKLRTRADMATLTVADVNANYDPDRGKYYPKGNNDGIQVDPVLWEIRRERIVELMGEGFGFYDVRRWRMAPWFINRPATGIWMSKENAIKNKMTLFNPQTGMSDGTNGSMTEGRLFLFNDPIKEGKGWLEKYYLYQVPTTEIVLNPNLTQNPGW